MRDVDYENYQKKVTARSAKNRVRHTGCTLPHENMSKKELKAMNGEVESMNLKRPMAYADFKRLPASMRTAYLQHLRNEYDMRSTQLGKMFGITGCSAADVLKRNGVDGCHSRSGWSRKQEERWDAFLAQGSDASAEEPKPVEAEKPEATEPAPKTEQSASVKLNGVISTEGKLYDVCAALVMVLGANTEARVTVSFGNPLLTVDHNANTVQ